MYDSFALIDVRFNKIGVLLMIGLNPGESLLDET